MLSKNKGSGKLIETALAVTSVAAGIMVLVFCILEAYWEHQEYKEKTKKYFDKHRTKYNDGDNT